VIRSRSKSDLRHRCRSRRECCCGNQPTPWFLTMHAIARAREMGVTRDEVVAVLDDPEIRYSARGGRFLACRGDLAVCFENNTVVSVLWRHEFTRAAC
jgi:hypothetical protein